MNKPQPLMIDGKVASWENPQFTPGVHCTKCRFGVLTEPRDTQFKYTCNACLPSVRAWWKRHVSAMQGVAKRRANKRKYVSSYGNK